MTDGAPMRLDLDQGVPRDAATRLRGLGYDCMHVGEIGMCKSADEEILAWSLGKNAVVVTLDADFHTILAVSGAGGPSVIRLRVQGLGAQEVVRVGSARTRRIRRRFEARISGHSEGAQDNLSPPADRQF